MLFSVTRGQVLAILNDGPELQEVSVEIEGESAPQRAYNYPSLFRPLQVGDRVILNTAAVKLGLGTGGRHFVVPDYEAPETPQFPGHIMKLRYTPWQFPVLAAEEEASPFHAELVGEGVQDKTGESLLAGVPVVAAPLHSMLPGVILGFRSIWGDCARIAYIMTDGAALPLVLSNLVRDLKQKNLLQATITAGHAFGGDYEAVSIPSAIAVAKKAVRADLIIVALGPGIVGTGTTYGFSGIEQSWVIDLAARLGGIPIAAPRISGADARPRHRGISHHTLTILNLANNPAHLALSRRIPRELTEVIEGQLRGDQRLAKHYWHWTDETPAAQLFEVYDIKVRSMGRNVQDDPGFFQSSAAAGFLAAKALQGQLRDLPPVFKDAGIPDKTFE